MSIACTSVGRATQLQPVLLDWWIMQVLYDMRSAC